MLKKIIKTIVWVEGDPLHKDADNITQDTFAAFFDKIAACPDFHDITDKVIAHENACMYISRPESAVEFIFNKYQTLSSLKQVDEAWYFLDCQESAVICFFPKDSKFMIEAYFLSDKPYQAVHFIQDDYQRIMVHIVFTNNLPLERMPKDNGSSLPLRQYLPRDLHDFLGSGKRFYHTEHHTEVQDNKNSFATDKGDML